MAAVYNLPTEQGIVSNILKTSKMIPVDKGANITKPSNFRPISVLSMFAQIFEKLVCKQLAIYVEKYDISYQYQFGFRKGRSTFSQLLQKLQTIFKQSTDNNNYLFTCGVFLDFAKDFNIVNHATLLGKLEAFRVVTAMQPFSVSLATLVDFKE